MGLGLKALNLLFMIVMCALSYLQKSLQSVFIRCWHIKNSSLNRVTALCVIFDTFSNWQNDQDENTYM